MRLGLLKGSIVPEVVAAAANPADVTAAVFPPLPLLMFDAGGFKGGLTCAGNCCYLLELLTF